MNANIPNSEKKRVVIIGGGFGGLKMAQEISKEIYQVVLIDRNNYHQFQPLFYQVATSGLEASSISFPLRQIFHKHKNILHGLESDACNSMRKETVGHILYEVCCQLPCADLFI